MKEYTLEEIIEIAESAIGKTVGEIASKNPYRNESSKGSIGHIVEEGLFKYKINNDRKPDFENLGIELKVTGYVWVYGGKRVSAKERLIITMIDYYNDYKDAFFESACYKKMEKMLLILYEYDYEKNRDDFIITNYYLYDFNDIPEKDKIIILNDWDTIMNKIKAGFAHELSEADTMYLGAAPKGQSRKSVTNQPFSQEKAMRRAYSLKTTYMTYLFRGEIFDEEVEREEFIKDISSLRFKSLDEIIVDNFSPYIGMSLTEFDKLFDIPVKRKNNKQFLMSYVSRLMHVKDANNIEEFEKANIQIKTIRINKDNKIKESMSFPSFCFKEVASEGWEESQLRTMLSTTKFLFVVFKELDIKTNEYELLGVKLWNMPIKTIDDEVRDVWLKTNHILNNELQLRIKNNTVYNNFPKKSHNKVSHVRPHGSYRSTTKPLPSTTNIKILDSDGSFEPTQFIEEHSFTAQCFWLNNTYILEIISDIL